MTSQKKKSRFGTEHRITHGPWAATKTRITFSHFINDSRKPCSFRAAGSLQFHATHYKNGGAGAFFLLITAPASQRTSAKEGHIARPKKAEAPKLRF
ncbi:hypothetical protein CDAR_442691 [Caerostris darwini]|uniref:Uncharacterized protein n=1 Tax=Caerostris darwini TaxID=1538125 RepID=A0AAV4VPX7_9ARAC|nr:hypothetical protein CDAR_442691 [Caerostris darwini]